MVPEKFNLNEVQKTNLELMRETLASLENELKSGNFLHGTKSGDLTELVPKQASDAGTEGGPTNMEGVYAEKYDIRIPVMMALFDKFDRTKPAHMGYSVKRKAVDDVSSIAQITQGENVTFTDGYVYVLPPDTFRLHENEHTREHISSAPVQASKKYKVTPEIITLLKNIEFIKK